MKHTVEKFMNDETNRLCLACLCAPYVKLWFIRMCRIGCGKIRCLISFTAALPGDERLAFTRHHLQFVMRSSSSSNMRGQLDDVGFLRGILGRIFMSLVGTQVKSHIPVLSP